MHEVSICQSILNTLENEMKDRLEYVREVHVKIGVLSCVDAQVLKHVYRYVIMDGPCKDSVLHTQMVDVLARCPDCRQDFKVEQYSFVCPACSKPSSELVEGNELKIYKIILEEPSYAEINQ
jgi:hydrogenase nickel incorporation protein HypA/HybF